MLQRQRFSIRAYMGEPEPLVYGGGTFVHIIDERLQ
jgi:hypothetical protein